MENSNSRWTNTLWKH